LRWFAASVVLLSLCGAAFADEFKTPSVSAVHVEWRAALDQLKSELSSRPSIAERFTFASRRRLPAFDPRVMPAFEQLNAITSRIYTGISRSPVPVLLPFDTAFYLSDRASGVPDSVSPSHYQSGFRPVEMFAAGASGYDAVFALPPGHGNGAPDRVYAKPVLVQITGSVLVYDIDDPFAGKGESVRVLAGQFPDLKRVIREGFVRYRFTRFGVPYVVSIQCLDSVPRSFRLACREASSVAEQFLKALRIAGGLPSRPRISLPAMVVQRPFTASPDFTYRPSGDIIAKSGYREQDGHPDFTVYSQIRFPLENAPAYANSQSFLNWGDCFLRGRIPPPSHKGASYHCKSNDKPLVFDESAGENYAYPWQDNFCEARDFGVGQCASGFGHQGQDIRPSSCILRNDGADRCEPNKFAVVAVRDGVLIRAPKQQAATLLVNTMTEHIRFRYMHMNPEQMDADGVLSGRRVAEGEKIGLVSNYQDYPGGTTSHLHFDVQVFTREGWLWVNPYVTLISAYEHLIDGRGREIKSGPSSTPADAKAPTADSAKPIPSSGTNG
jgi:hypothetical protein